MFDILRYGDLPPAGMRVDIAQRSRVHPQFPGYAAYWLNSGTAALAAALLIAKNHRQDTDTPEVLLPAYACPDLLAAAKFAGVRPILVDIDADDPGYSLEALSAAVTRNTCAVIAVNFLGIRERLGAIRQMFAAVPGVLLIEDNAQWFPEPVSDSKLEGDLVCLSFGRGKPVSLLGGGALLVKEPLRFSMPVFATAQPAARLRFKAAAYNQLLHRRWYGLANRNPFFSLGETRYKPLEMITVMDALRLGALQGNVQRYLQQPRDVEQRWNETFSTFRESVMPLATDHGRGGRLLRFPILCRDAQLRDSLWREWHGAGLGASRMYRHVLPQVESVAAEFKLHGAYPGATAFASRLLTLPVHSQVSSADVARAATILGRVV